MAAAPAAAPPRTPATSTRPRSPRCTQIPGGLIRNAALAAAFAAAAAGRPIDQGSLVDAVRDEYRKAGRSFPGAPRAIARESARARGGR